jgi:hypothetical protein
MNKHIYSGGCHCGNITLTFTSKLSSTDIEPRACDCDFCQKYAAAYVSDPDGSLEVKIINRDATICYTQGSGVAIFTICRTCGVLTFVRHDTEDTVYAAINSRALDDFSSFKDPVTVSPRKLSLKEKESRWFEIWISDVMINEDAKQ